jgi:hypothetical protein
MKLAVVVFCLAVAICVGDDIGGAQHGGQVPADIIVERPRRDEHTETIVEIDRTPRY